MNTTETKVAERMADCAVSHFQELSKGSDFFWDIALETMDVVDPELMERVFPKFKETLLKKLKETTVN